jgi:hypothetical protein
MITRADALGLDLKSILVGIDRGKNPNQWYAGVRDIRVMRIAVSVDS